VSRAGDDALALARQSAAVTATVLDAPHEEDAQLDKVDEEEDGEEDDRDGDDDEEHGSDGDAARSTGASQSPTSTEGEEREAGRTG